MYAVRALTPAQARHRAFLIGGGALAILVAAACVGLVNRQPILDEKTLCPQEKKLDTSVVVLVDTTDALTRTQANHLIVTVRDARDDLPTYGKLTILLLNAAAPYEPTELVSLCNPGSPRFANPLFQTASRIAMRYRESFGAPVEAALDTLLRAPSAKRSPILQSVAGLTWRPDFDARVKNRTLFIVSDLLQHEPGGYSQYQQGDLWAPFIRTGLAKKVEADLTGVKVRIDYLHRPEAMQYQNDAHRHFWMRWLTERGASSVDFGISPTRTPSVPAPVAKAHTKIATEPVK